MLQGFVTFFFLFGFIAVSWFEPVPTNSPINIVIHAGFQVYWLVKTRQGYSKEVLKIHDWYLNFCNFYIWTILLTIVLQVREGPITTTAFVFMTIFAPLAVHLTDWFEDRNVTISNSLKKVGLYYLIPLCLYTTCIDYIVDYYLDDYDTFFTYELIGEWIMKQFDYIACQANNLVSDYTESCRHLNREW